MPSSFRFTPTRVGKSMYPLPIRLDIAVHPHTCGEIRHREMVVRRHRGSPPHVWGNLPRSLPRRMSCRFTPTRVGKSHQLVMRCRKPPVHPHTCGEIFSSFMAPSTKAGSPPHVWGNLQAPAIHTTTTRFTPTRVGKSAKSMSSQARHTVHPHTCGEIVTMALPCGDSVGSPPHVWGNLLLANALNRNDRFTPTRVGKSSAS